MVRGAYALERNYMINWKAHAKHLRRGLNHIVEQDMDEFDRLYAELADTKNRLHDMVEERNLKIAALEAEVENWSKNNMLVRQAANEDVAKAEGERDAALRELERWRHGQQIEGDYVCPDSLRLLELEKLIAESPPAGSETGHRWVKDRDLDAGLAIERCTVCDVRTVYVPGAGKIVQVLCLRGRNEVDRIPATPPAEDARCEKCVGNGWIGSRSYVCGECGGTGRAAKGDK